MLLCVCNSSRIIVFFWPCCVYRFQCFCVLFCSIVENLENCEIQRYLLPLHTTSYNDLLDLFRNEISSTTWLSWSIRFRCNEWSINTQYLLALLWRYSEHNHCDNQLTDTRLFWSSFDYYLDIKHNQHHLQLDLHHQGYHQNSIIDQKVLCDFGTYLNYWCIQYDSNAFNLGFRIRNQN